jgi:hypothetical protein
VVRYVWDRSALGNLSVGCFRIESTEVAKMPLYLKIDFRTDGCLGVWWTRYENAFHKTTSSVSATRIRQALIAVADEIDPEESPEPENL